MSLVQFAAVLTRNGTDGRVYGGDCNLVHIEDHTRRDFGRDLAFQVEHMMRHRDPALRRQSAGELDGGGYPGAREFAPAAGVVIDWTRPLCPGCYMIALFNAAVELVRANGQPLAELGRTMAQAFSRLAEETVISAAYEACLIEEIAVILDGDAE